MVRRCEKRWASPHNRASISIEIARSPNVSLFQSLFRRAAGSRGQSVAWIDVHADPENRCLIHWTWAQFAGAALTLSARLAQRGVCGGDHVAIVCDNGLPLVLTLAALRIVGLNTQRHSSNPPGIGNPLGTGAVDIVIDTRLPDSLASEIVRHCDARFVLMGDSHRNRDLGNSAIGLELESLLAGIAFDPIDRNVARATSDAIANLPPDEPESILYTSGTTDTPKGVVLSHANLLSNAQAKLAALGQRPDDRRLTVLPLSHAYARTCDLGTWLLSGCALSATSAWQGWMHYGPRVQPTLINTVPAFAERLLSHIEPAALGSLRMLGCGGAAMSEDVYQAFAERSITVIQGYGLTEAGPVIASATPQNSRPGYVGTAAERVQVKLDASGQLLCRSPGVMLGYYNDPQTTSQVLIDGWLHTGDLVHIDPQDGQLQIGGRCDDLIVLSSGHNVMPGPIEARLCQIDGISHAMLFRGPQGELQLWVNDLWQRAPHELQHQIDLALLDTPGYARPRQVNRSQIELSQAAGTITAKGTIRRAAIHQRLAGWPERTD